MGFEIRESDCDYTWSFTLNIVYVIINVTVF